MTPDEFRASEAERVEMADLSDRLEAAAERADGAGAVLDRAVAERRWPVTTDQRFALALADVGYVDPHPTEQYQLVETDRIIAALRARGIAIFDAQILLDALRFTAHDLRLCKSSDYWHAIAHDDSDESGYRTILAASLHSALADRKNADTDR